MHIDIRKGRLIGTLDFHVKPHRFSMEKQKIKTGLQYVLYAGKSTQGVCDRAAHFRGSVWRKLLAFSRSFGSSGFTTCDVQW